MTSRVAGSSPSLWLATWTLGLAACSGGGGGGSTAPAIAYPRTITIGAVGVALDPLPATAPGALSFTIAPPLAAGLAFDPATGRIDGTPSAPAAATVHTVTADFGTTVNGPLQLQATVEIEVVQPARFAIATNGLDDTLSTFAVDATTGGLEPRTYTLPPAGDAGARTLAVHPAGTSLAVPNEGSDSLRVVTLDPITGQLGSGSTVAAGVDPIEAAYHPSGAFCFVLAEGSNEVLGYDVDPTDGALTPFASGASTPTGAGPIDLELSRDGSLLAVLNGLDATLTVFRVDPTDGALTAAGTLATGAGPSSLAIARSNDFVWVANETARSLTVATLDGSGAPALALDVDLGAVEPLAIAAEPTGRFLYAIDGATGRLATYAITATGAVSLRGTPTSSGIGSGPDAIVVDPTGLTLWVVAHPASELRRFDLDPLNGAPELVSASRTRGLPMALGIATGNGPVERLSTNVYVANLTSDDVTNYAVDALGDLTEIGPPSGANGSPTALTVHPSGPFVYAVRKAAEVVDVFQVDPTTKRLGLIATHPVGQAPQSLTVEPSGRFLYVANSDSNTISIFDIDSQSGDLTPAAQPVANGGPRPISLAADPTGRFLLVGNSGFDQPTRDITSLAIDPFDGSLTELDDAIAGGRPNDITVHPSGRFGYSALDNTGLAVLWTLDADGDVTPIVGRLAGEAPKAVTIDRTGRFMYVASRGLVGSTGDVQRYSIDPITGVHTRLGPTNAGDSPRDVAIDAAGTTLYVANQDSNDVSVFTISTVTGGLTPRATVPTGLMPTSIGVRVQLQ